MPICLSEIFFTSAMAGGHRPRGRGRVAPVQVQRIDHVFHGERLAVVEGDALAQVKNSHSFGARLRLPAFQKLGNGLVVLVDLDQSVHQHEGLIDRTPVRQLARVERVGGRAAADADFRTPPFLGAPSCAIAPVKLPGR